MTIDDGDYIDEIQLDILVDNETGFILWFKSTQGDCTEEYSVDTLLFNEDAELPEDGAYIQERFDRAVFPTVKRPLHMTLSVLDETPDSENIG